MKKARTRTIAARSSRRKKSAPSPARSGQTRQAQTRRIVIVGYERAASLDIAGPFDVFTCATELARERTHAAAPAYRVEILAIQDRVVTTWGGLRLCADHTLDDLTGNIDTVLIAGGLGSHAAMQEERLISWLRTVQPRVRRMGAVCTGAFILAAAGILDGRRATTHWNWADQLAREFPGIAVEPDAIFVSADNVYTSAGVTAGIDLALSLVEEDLGHEVALAVARALVVFLKRPGGQSQFSQPLAAQTIAAGPFRGLPEWIIDHLMSDLRVDVLAAQAGMSPRNFARAFVRELGMTPAKFVEALRLEQACSCLADGRGSLKEIAQRCGFGSDERMRRAFVRAFRVPPEDYRKRFSS